MFLRWKNAVLQMLETWLSKERLLSNSTPRFLTDEEEEFTELQGTKVTAQAIRRSMASLVVLERHLWLNLTEIKEADKASFLDSPVSPTGLFGPAIEGFAEHFTAAQKSSQAMRHFLPKCSSSVNATSRPKPAPTQQPAKPTPSPAQPTQKPEPQQCSRSARCYPFPKRQGPQPKLTLDPAPQVSS